MQKQRLVSYLKGTFRVSHAWACRIIKIGRTTRYYKKKMPAKDAKLSALIKSVIGCSRKGREKVIRLIQRKHPQISASKIRRVYQKEGFSLYKRLKRRVKQQIATPLTIPLMANVEWAMDFMSDTLENGRRFRTLNVIDHFNRACKGIAVAHSLPTLGVIDHLERMIEMHGKPQRIRTDNGPEFRSKRFQKWLKGRGIEWVSIQPGKPAQNGIVERFNRSYREDVLDAHLFDSLAQAQGHTELWIEEYNTERPHQALNYQTPKEYAA